MWRGRRRHLGPCGPRVTGPPPPERRRLTRALAAYRKLRDRRRRLELWLEHRYPKLYDARHADTGVGRALWPLVGPLLAALIVLPIVALLAALVALLGLHAPSIDLAAGQVGRRELLRGLAVVLAAAEARARARGATKVGAASARDAQSG
jgi:hypothetical protein